MGDNERGSGGVQTLRRSDGWSSRRSVGELLKNNATLQEIITKAKEEDSFSKGGNKGIRQNLDISGEGSAERGMERWVRNRGPIIRNREDHSPTDGEEDQEDRTLKRRGVGKGGVSDE